MIITGKCSRASTTRHRTRNRARHKRADLADFSNYRLLHVVTNVVHTKPRRLSEDTVARILFAQGNQQGLHLPAVTLDD